MQEVKPIINRIELSGLITLNLEDYFPKQEEILAIDLKQFLFKELILREADFRETIKQTDWTKYTGKYVVIHSSANAIIPLWAYMLLSAALSPYAKDVACSSPEHAAEIFLYRNIANMNMNEFADGLVIVKGCGERQIPEAAYVQITERLSKVVRSLMYGDACSSVPVFKKSATT